MSYPDVDPQLRFPALEARVLQYWERDGTFPASVAARPAGVQVRASGNGLTTADWAAPLATACANVAVQVP